MTAELKKDLTRILLALFFFVVVELIPFDVLFNTAQSALAAEFICFLVPYLIAGYDVIIKAARNIVRGMVLDECFLMCIATLGAFGLVFFPEAEPHMAEGAAVMIFYQIGEWFEHYAVGKSRASISEMLDIAPETAHMLVDGELVTTHPDNVKIGSTIVVKPGERIPLDGVVISGSSSLDTAALTGESMPRYVQSGSAVISGCINQSGALTIKTNKAFENSTVMRILELVEEASDKKARSEAFITRFAKYYTPVVVLCALAIALVPPVLGLGAWSDWIARGLIFLVVSCPCALVISVPLSFFCGIGAASRQGILVKGSNYLEQLAHVSTIVFDKTGTLTTGSFMVDEVFSTTNSADSLLKLCAHAESMSTHPLAKALRDAYLSRGGILDQNAVSDVIEHTGKGIEALVEGKHLLIGNRALLLDYHIESLPVSVDYGSILHVAIDKTYAGYLVLSDAPKPQTKQALSSLHAQGVEKLIMLTGDRRESAAHIAQVLGIDSFFAELLPQDKVERFEEILSNKSSEERVAFVGDGINDAPVLMRSDVGIAMGALGSDAAIEAADLVLMDDNPAKIALAMRIARKTMTIVKENIVFALGVKFAVLILAAFGLANMWLAVFADVGVAALAILNAMRALAIKE